MKITDILSLSTRMFKTRTLRTFLTILGVSIGIGAVLFLVSLGYGMQNVILSQITTADSLLSLDISTGASGLVEINESKVKEILAFDNVVETSRMKSISAQMTLGDLTSDGVAHAIDTSFFRLHGLRANVGQLISTDDERGMVISSASARLFNLKPKDAVGKEVHLTLFIQRVNEAGFEDVEIAKQEEPYTIRGVILDDNLSFVYVPLQTISTSGIDQYDVLKVKVDSQLNSELVREQIIGQGFLVSSLSDIIDQANQIFGVVQIVLGLFGLIALTVSAIGMFNTMTIALLERTNEIGIMRSVGVTKRDIRKLFLLESMLMGLLGGVVGVLLGWLAGETANAAINILAKKLGGESLDLFIQPVWFIVVIISFSTIIGFLTGIFPSQRAAKMDPLEALRYK